MNYVVFDIETSNIFSDVGKRDPKLLDISVVAIYNAATDDYKTFDQDELTDLWSIIEKADALVGYNCDHFDVPLLDKYYPGDLTKMRTIDLMKDIQKSFGRRVGLDAVANATIGAEKSAHGLQATQWWKDGEKQKVRDYCVQDVKVTKELYEHMRDNKFVKIADKLTGDVEEYPIDVSEWDKKKSSITHTLPF